MIPKIIHYVWVGGQPKSKEIQACLASWKRRLPDYQIIEWNESNIDLHENKYIEQAYAAKKWAFVSDYVRAKALEQQGGIYLDTDVMVLTDFDDLLGDRAVNLVKKTPIANYGVPIVSPHYDNGEAVNLSQTVSPVVQAFWNLAAAKTGNQHMLRRGLGALYL